MARNKYYNIDKAYTPLLSWAFPSHSIGCDVSSKAIVYTSLPMDVCDELYFDCIIICPYGEHIGSEFFNKRLTSVGKSIGIHHTRKLVFGEDTLKSFKEYAEGVDERGELLELIGAFGTPMLNEVWCRKVKECGLDSVVNYLNFVFGRMYNQSTAFYNKLKAKYGANIRHGFDNIELLNLMSSVDNNDVYGFGILNIYKRLLYDGY